MPLLFRRLFWLCLLTVIGTAAQGQSPGQPLTAEEIRAFVSGKTVREFVHKDLMREVYYTPEGRAFLVKSDRKLGFTEPVASAWTVRDHFLCRPDVPLTPPRQSMSRLPDGTVRLYYGQDRGYVSLRTTDGDPDQLMARVQQYAANATVRADMQAEARRGAVPDGNYLTGDEIRTLVSGKTLRELPAQRIGVPDPPTFLYLAADGMGYLAANRGQTTWRGPWVIDGRRLCLQGAYWPCSDFRRTADGRIMKEYGGSRGSRTVELFEGDSEGVVQIVANSPSYNQPTGTQGNLRP